MVKVGYSSSIIKNPYEKVVLKIVNIFEKKEVRAVKARSKILPKNNFINKNRSQLSGLKAIYVSNCKFITLSLRKSFKSYNLNHITLFTLKNAC